MKIRLMAVLPVLALAACSGAANPDAQSAAVSGVAKAQGRPAKAGLCVACHGPFGVSNLPGHPHIAGQDESYLRDALLKYRSGERAHAPMKAVVGGLGEADIAALARYYAQLPRDGLGPAEH
jgi:cytochrome c553